MEYTVETSQFPEALKQVQGAVDKKHTVPVISHCLIEVMPHGVQTAGTDLEFIVPFVIMGLWMNTRMNVSASWQSTFNLMTGSGTSSTAPSHAEKAKHSAPR